MPDDDDLIDAAPCPKCKAPLAVAAADLGYLIECPSCGTQSRARRAEPSPSKSPPPATDRSADQTGDPAPRRRNWDGDERDREPDRDRDEDDHEDRRPRGSVRGRDRSRDMDRHDRDDRRGRFRDDDFDRPRRPGQGAAVGAAVMNFSFAAVALLGAICGGFVAANAYSEGRRGDQDAPFGSNQTASLVFMGFGVCNLLGVGLMIPAGIGLLQRRDYGRTLGFLSAGLGLIYALGLIIIMLAILSAARGSEPAVVVFGIPILLWLAYSVTNLILLGKVRPQSRS